MLDRAWAWLNQRLSRIQEVDEGRSILCKWWTYHGEPVISDEDIYLARHRAVTPL